MPLRDVLKNRWLIAVAGVIMQLCLGSVYGWSIFVKPFEQAFDWEKPDVTLAFSITIASLGLAAAFGGFLSDKKGPRFTATLGAILFGAGTILTGFAVVMESLFLIYLFYGIIAGIGLGLCYITPISVLVKWFPDKRGMITGIAVMGFGFGAYFMTTFGPRLIIAFSATSEFADVAGISQTFYLLGSLFFVLTLVSATQLRNPPSGLTAHAATASSLGIAPAMAMRQREFYLLWVILFVNIAAGIALISLASPFLQETYGLTATKAGSIVGIFSVFNGFGRLFWSWISDTIGRKMVFLIFFITQAIVFALLPATDSFLVFVVFGCYLYTCYGGGFATMPAFATDTFGSKHIGTIYGFMLTAWSAAAICGPMLFAFIAQNRNIILFGLSGYDLAFALAAVLFAVAMFLPYAAKPISNNTH